MNDTGVTSVPRRETELPAGHRGVVVELFETLERVRPHLLGLDIDMLRRARAVTSATPHEEALQLLDRLEELMAGMTVTTVRSTFSGADIFRQVLGGGRQWITDHSKLPAIVDHVTRGGPEP